MGVVVPNFASSTEDRTSGALVIDGSLKSNGSIKTYLTRTPGSAGNRRTFTWSGWIKRNTIPESNAVHLFSAGSSGASNVDWIEFQTDNTLRLGSYDGSSFIFQYVTSAVFRDPSAWYHIVLAVDTTIASPSSDRIKLYVNGSQITAFSTANAPNQNAQCAHFNNTSAHYIIKFIDLERYFNGQLTNYYLIDGQQLDPSYFGYTDPLTNTWRPKKLSSSVAFGTNGFYLPLDGNTLIGQDRSGRGNNWTPVNFGGSNTIEKATGALPILNTDGGGKVARVGVRTDTNASSLVLALPLVGIKSDFSNAINSGTSNKAVTVTGTVTFPTTRSIFYGSSLRTSSGNYLTASGGGSGGNFDFGSGDFTVECWANANSINASSAHIISAWFDSSNLSFAIAHGGGGAQNMLGAVTTFNGSQINLGFSATTVMSVDTWYHLVLVRNSNTVSFYINGILNASSSITGSITTPPSVLTIGTHSSSTSTYYFDGYIQDLRIYKGVAKYTQNFIPASTDPDILPDTPSGVAYSSTLSLPTSNEGGSLMFDGSGDYLRFSQSSDWAFGTGDFSIEYFIFPNYTTDTLGFGGTRGAAGTSAGWNIGLINEDTAGGYIQMYSDGGIAPTNAHRKILYRKWTHVVYTRSGSTIRAIIDGVLHNTASNSQNWTLNDFSIGITGAGAAEPYLGFLSNIRIIKGSIPTSYQTSSTTLGTKIFDVPTSTLTTTSQGATSGDVKFLGCNSLTAITDFTVTPNTPTVNGNVSVSVFNPFTVNINTVRGQETGYCTLNPLTSPGTNYITLSNGNLDQVALTETVSSTKGTVGVTTGKWYWECNLKLLSSGGVSPRIGICRQSAPTISQAYGADEWVIFMTDYAGYGGRGGHNSTIVGTDALFSNGDIGMFALDMNSSKIYFGKNGIWLNGGNPVNGSGAFFTDVTGEIFPLTNTGYYSSVSMNFGQKPFKFPPPAGFQPLALANTPRPTIVRPDQYVGVTTYTGTGATRTVGGLLFSPDFVWIKGRVGTEGVGQHRLYDTVRGVTNAVYSNLNFAQESDPNCLTQFNTNGFTIGSSGGVNDGSTTYVSWCWKAGGSSNTFNINNVGYATASAAGLTAGTITPTGASVNTKSGFSIIRWNGSGASGTISHGLGNTPGLIFLKGISAGEDGQNWRTYHSVLGTSPSNTLFLNLTNASSSNTERISAVGTSTFTLSSGGAGVNVSGQSYIAYLWAEIPGFSKFGSYTGNGSADGPVVITGFRPRWVLIKMSSSTGSWYLIDTARLGYNPDNNPLYPNLSVDEQTDDIADILSNGFKIRNSFAGVNTSSGTYIYAAFAETPSFNLYGGQANAR